MKSVKKSRVLTNLRLTSWQAVANAVTPLRNILSNKQMQTSVHAPETEKYFLSMISAAKEEKWKTKDEKKYKS